MTTIEPTLSAASTSLLSSLLANPFDTFRRGLLSDQLSDNREELPELTLPTGAVVVRDGYGLPWEVRCTMTQWCGERCRYCTGGYIHNDMHDSPDTDGCNNCNWTGRVEGIARAVCERWPVTTVRLSDKRSDNGAFWKESSGDNPNDPSILPEKLFNIMSKMYPNRHRSINRRGFSETQSEHNIYFAAHPKSISADDALSLTAVNYGRDLAGLPPL